MYNPYQQQQYNPYLQQFQQMQAQQQGAVNNSLVSVRSEAEARNYPVAPGNSVTFKDENAPYIYTKTMGFSQLDRPVFERFKLVKEQEVAQNEVLASEPTNSIPNEEKSKLDVLSQEFESIKNDVAVLKKFMSQFDDDGGVENDTK